jgi:hypothetical protein
VVAEIGKGGSAYGHRAAHKTASRNKQRPQKPRLSLGFLLCCDTETANRNKPIDSTSRLQYMYPVGAMCAGLNEVQYGNTKISE